MGQKIRPNSLRLGITQNWTTRFFAKKNFRKSLEENEVFRKVIRERISQAGIDKIEIERSADHYRITIKVARPGLVIGRGGKGIEELHKALEVALAVLDRKRGTKEKVTLNLNVEELKRTEVSASVTAQNIAWDLEKRLPFRRTMKKCVEGLMQNREVQGAKLKLSGRLDGNEIARREWMSRGKLPLQTLRANIDYGEATAFNTYGTVGVKVWIYKGEIFQKDYNRK